MAIMASWRASRASVGAPDDGDPGGREGVEGIGRVTGDPAAHGVEVGLVPAEEGVEGVTVARLGGREEVGVGVGVV